MCFWFDQPSLNIPWVLCKTYLMLGNLKGIWLKILILGKLGLKLLFLKNMSSHTHAFCSSISMFWGVPKMCFVFFQNYVFLSKFKWVSVCFDWSSLFFDQLKLFLKNLKEPLFVSINRNWFLINRKSWIRFLKILFWLVQLIFFKTFLNFSFSLRLGLAHSSNFCRFPPKFLQGFSSL